MKPWQKARHETAFHFVEHTRKFLLAGHRTGELIFLNYQCTKTQREISTTCLCSTKMDILLARKNTQLLLCTAVAIRSKKASSLNKSQ